jgi:ferredoxin
VCERENDRRDFLKKASAALVILPLAEAATVAGETEPLDDSKSSGRFQPEEFWRERMKAPDDGKKLGWFVDTRRCIGCHACEVSCKAENEVPLGHFIRQTFYKDVGEHPRKCWPTETVGRLLDRRPERKSPRDLSSLSRLCSSAARDWLRRCPSFPSWVLDRLQPKRLPGPAARELRLHAQ